MKVRRESGPNRTTSKQGKASGTRRLKVAGGPEVPRPRLVVDAIKALHPVVQRAGVFYRHVDLPSSDKGLCECDEEQLPTFVHFASSSIWTTETLLMSKLWQLTTTMRLVSLRHLHSMELVPEKVRRPTSEMGR